MVLAALDRGARGMEQGGPRFLFPLFMIGLLVLLFTIVRRKRRAGHMHYRGGSPTQVLADRFARGEIDRKEYVHRLAVLNGDDVVPPAPDTPAPPAPPASSGSTVEPEVATDVIDEVLDDDVDNDGTA